MPFIRLKIFVSSVQGEFKQTRKDLKSFLLGDAILSRYISEVFLFEDLPARDQSPSEAFLEELERCDIYLGIYGYEYGNEDENGVSPTEHEFNYATDHYKTRFIYVWGLDDTKRNPKMKKLVYKASNDLIRRRVEDFNALTSEVYASIIDHLIGLGAISIPPFDTAVNDVATLTHLARKRIDWFIDKARRERKFPLNLRTSTDALLKHLNLLNGDKPNNAAILLFSDNPQRFHRTAETKCVYAHGSEYQRPFISQQIYTGDLFNQVDQAQDFVLSKLDRSVGTRTTDVTAPATYELPPDAVREAIVNAIVHRDYYSNASVEVRLFNDRLEIWNPGFLPSNLTPENLRTDHPSVPNNPFLAESLYLTRYIEKAGTGTQMMIKLCLAADLPEPDFEQRDGFFVVTLWRDWLTSTMLAKMNLTDRQSKVIDLLKQQRRLTNSEYQKATNTTRATAKRDLEILVEKGLLIPKGKGRGAYYELPHKRLINGS